MPPEHHTLTVEPDDAGQRLDVFLAARLPDLTRSHAKRLLDAGQVRLDEAVGRPRDTLRAGQVVTVDVPEPEPMDVTPEDIPLEVVYEDADLLVVNKPAGLVTHPARGHWHGTLVNALLGRVEHLSTVAGPFRPGIVHRLDRDTTGLLVVARNDTAHHRLATQIAERTAHREYLAVVYGDPEFATTLVDAPIGRHPAHRERMALVESGRLARTHLEVRERFTIAALLIARLETGRTHQVRVHCTSLGHPLLGDRTYGLKRAREYQPLPPAVAAAEAALPGQALHAYRLSFRHPTDGRELAFEAPPTPAFARLVQALRDAS